jgi:hypothetical protein
MKHVMVGLWSRSITSANALNHLSFPWCRLNDALLLITDRIGEFLHWNGCVLVVSS